MNTACGVLKAARDYLWKSACQAVPLWALTAGSFNSQVSSAVTPEDKRCGEGQFEVQEGDLFGAQDFVACCGASDSWQLNSAAWAPGALA